MIRGHIKWWRNLLSNWAKFKHANNFSDETEMSELVGGHIRATKYMTGLLAASNGYYTWENYGIFWDTDHWPIPDASIILGIHDPGRVYYPRDT